MNHYIFFDIDGVLNNKHTRTKAPYDCPGIDHANLSVLKEIARVTSGDLVLISDWRLSFLPGDHMPKMADYITKRFHKEGLSFALGSTNNNYEMRTQTIKNWIETHKTEGYIVIDDDESHYPQNNKIQLHLLLVDNKKGLNPKHIKEAIEKMNAPVETITL